MVCGTEGGGVMSKFMIMIDGKVHEIYANGRNVAVRTAINEHYGKLIACKVVFARYMTGGVVYKVTSKELGTIEAIVKQ
jgi:hypothetical protein